MTDFCYGRPMLRHVERQAAVMDRMMAQAGVAPAVAARLEQGVAFYEARTRCIGCHAVAQCRSWLTSSPAPGGQPSFCPNALFFETCRGQG